MKIYNPTTTGKRISIGKFVFNTDEYKNIKSKKIAGKLMRKFPFLVNIDEPKYKPSFNDIKLIKCRTIKIKLLEMLYRLKR